MRLIRPTTADCCSLRAPKAPDRMELESMARAADVGERRRRDEVLEDTLAKQLEAVRRLEDVDPAKSQFVADRTPSSRRSTLR